MFHTQIYLVEQQSQLTEYKLLNTINFVKSDMVVVKKISKEKNIFSVDSKISIFFFKLKNYIGMFISKFDNNYNPKSYNLFSSPFLKFINNSEYDLINLHWVNAETLSIEDINKINKPIIITMHDMWWLCGSENYLEYGNNNWKKGNFNNYLSNYIYNKKNPYFQKQSFSKWLINCARDSKLYNKSN